MSPWDEISEWDQWTTKCLGMRFRNETNGLLHQLKLSRFVQVAMVKHYSTLEFPSMVLEMEKDDYIITAGCDYYHHIGCPSKHRYTLGPLLVVVDHSSAVQTGARVIGEGGSTLFSKALPWEFKPETECNTPPQQVIKL